MSDLHVCADCKGVAQPPYKNGIDSTVRCEDCAVKTYKEAHPFTWNLGVRHAVLNTEAQE